MASNRLSIYLCDLHISKLYDDAMTAQSGMDFKIVFAMLVRLKLNPFE